MPDLPMELSGLDDLKDLTDKEIITSDEMDAIPLLLKPEVTDKVPGMDWAIVCGDPIALGDILDGSQGYDNPYGAFGTCGLNAIANICVMAGLDVTEPQVVEYAMENDLCTRDDPKLHGGGTTAMQQIKLLEHYGFPSHCELAQDGATKERLAAAVEGGHGVLLGLNSGVLQDRPWKIYNEDHEIVATHAVCLTGTVRDADTGFYMCDSSAQTPDAARTYVPVDKFDDCFGEIKGGFAVITDGPIRGLAG